MRAIPTLSALVLVAVGAAPAAAQDMASFRSPTGNIHCLMLGGNPAFARCDLRAFTPSYRRPADCDLDFGHAFEVASRGYAGPVCAGDTVIQPGSPVLPYGAAISLGGITCRSERTGMTCTNRDGHGFSVARAAQRVF